MSAKLSYIPDKFCDAKMAVVESHTGRNIDL